MAVSFPTIGYSIVAVAGVTLLLVGRPLHKLAAAADPMPLAAAPVALATKAVSAAGITLKSVSVELPSGDRMFPDGEGAETMNNNCLACHSAGMVLNQPKLSGNAWLAEANKMRSVYKAPVDAQDMPVIVGYLTRLKGNS
jgi:mono/diheme cytochrome c family protein